jgi:DNA repair ATPase RecN
MARLGVSNKKKSPRATELSQLKKELQSVSEQLESCKRELAEGRERETATSEILREIASSPTDIQPVLDVVVETLQNCVPLTMLCFSGSKATVCAGALTVGRCRP